MLKILALNWRDPLHPEAGGAEVHLDALLSYLAQKHNVTLISTKVKGQKKQFMYHGYEIVRLGHPLFFNFTFRFLWNKYFKNQNFDIIIDDISKIGLGTPSYIKKIPILGIFHHVHGDTLFQLLPYPIAIAVKFLEIYALKKYKDTCLVVVSESSQKELQNISSFKNTIILPNGIDSRYLKLSKIKKNPYQLCTVGRLTKAKRIDLAIHIFSNLLNDFPDARLIIVGKGPEEKNLKRLVCQLQIEEFISFKGFVSEEEKKNILSTSEAFLFTSEKEGWGIVAIEASACQTPVFGFDVPGIRDSVKTGINGYLAEFGNIELLSNALKYYFESSTEDKYRLQNKAYCYAKNFDWEKICQEFELILYNEINKKR